MTVALRISAKRRYMLEHPSIEKYRILNSMLTFCDNLLSRTISRKSPQKELLRDYTRRIQYLSLDDDIVRSLQRCRVRRIVSQIKNSAAIMQAMCASAYEPKNEQAKVESKS